TLFVALILAGSFLAWWSMQRWSAYSTLRQNRDG
ncbi:MAG: DNA-binding transcriptional regulator of glucitol operon, partial [Candidatus Azotimanducaceae bacterium]